MKINTIEERAADSALVRMNLSLGTSTTLGRMSQESTGTRIHRNNKTELTRETDGPPTSHQPHRPCLEGLTEKSEDAGPKLGDLIQK